MPELSLNKIRISAYKVIATTIEEVVIAAIIVTIATTVVAAMMAVAEASAMITAIINLLTASYNTNLRVLPLRHPRAVKVAVSILTKVP